MGRLWKLGCLSVTVCMALCFYTGVHSQSSKTVTANVGETATISCSLRNPSWFKNGTKMIGNFKVKPRGDKLFIFCLELSDSGVYECRNGQDTLRSVYQLVVKNPENKEFFHIYNEGLDQCLSTFVEDIVLAPCALHSCEQKWMWTKDRKIVNVNDLIYEPKCLSTDQPAVSGGLVHLENCSKALNWECKGDSLIVQKTSLYLNYKKSGDNVIVFEVARDWVKYITRNNLCLDNRKAIVTPAHVVTTEREAITIFCKYENFFKPSYTWLKDGKHVSNNSGLSLHVDSEVLFLPFTYETSSGNYTCVVEDREGTASATAVVEIYKVTCETETSGICGLALNRYPSVIRHSLNQQTLFGKDICLTCEMFANNTNYEVIWSKAGSPISKNNSRFQINTTSRIFKKFSAELCINSLQVDDAGMYSCEVKYSAKKGASALGNVQVYTKPEVFIYKLEEKDLLICNATGFPPPHLIWYKNGELIAKNKNNENSLTTKNTGSGNFTCVASNSAGSSSDSFVSAVSVVEGDDKGFQIYVIIGCVAGGILLLLLIILIICCYCRRKKEVVQTNNNSEGVYHTVRYATMPGQTSTSQSEYTTVDLPPKQRIEFHPRTSTDSGHKQFGIKAKYESLKPRAKGEWEVPYECVKLDKKLGEGQFGQVWKGEILARKGSRTVAIKMLRPENPSAQARRALIDELEFMKTMSPHPNIVGLVGCCTRSADVMIIVEFVPGGNLKDYLLYSRGNSKDTYANLAPYSATLTSKDLLTFAYQIARGMSYLEQIKCVHRDLAARNILVGDDKTCKIADFGLARDIYSENYYRKTNGGRLPLRWMAYESIFNGITTSQSDAWSFGIVLWEIVTLGGNPYPDMNRDQVIDGLQRGCRMPKPHHCSDEVFAVMWECWQQNPDKRPTFAELTATFLRLISLQQIFINMENFGEDDYVNVGSYEETGDN